jgi:hypothetical protein
MSRISTQQKTMLNSSLTLPPVTVDIPLPQQLALLLPEISSPDTRQYIEAIFTGSARLLSAVTVAAKAISAGAATQDVGPFFSALAQECRYLLTRMENAEVELMDEDGTLLETLDAIAFALSHEMGRAFTIDFSHDGSEGEERCLRADLIRACGLLENCLQQSVVTLAQTLDPRLTAEDIFNSFRERREQSLLLHAELKSLFELVKRMESAAGPLMTSRILYAVRQFRYEYMHLLMYRDWDEFERFADEMEVKLDSQEEFAPLLHRFSCYLETLIRHVGMRASLAENPAQQEA